MWEGGEDVKYGFISVVGVVGGFVSSFVGGFDTSFKIMLSFMVIDYVSALILACFFHKSPKTATGGLSSSVSFHGLIRKIMMIVFVGVAHLLDMQLGSDYIRNAVCIAFMVNELISLIENFGLMGVPIPKVITNAIELLKDGEEHESKHSN